MIATLIIPTYNRAAGLHRLLRHLSRVSSAPVGQVIVCDDGSTDDTRSVCASFRDLLPVEYCYQEDLGFRAGAARNLGISRAKGDVLIFLDDDCLPLDGFVASHCAAHMDARPVVGVGLRSRMDPGHDSPCLFTLERPIVADEREPLLANGFQSHPAPWKLLYSCNFSIRRDHPQAYFDEAFVGWGMEDTELGYRLWMTGTEFRLVKGAEVVHVDAPLPRDPFRVELQGQQPDYRTYLMNCVRLLLKFEFEAPLRDSLLPDLRWYGLDPVYGWVKDGHEHDPWELVSKVTKELCYT